MFGLDMLPFCYDKLPNPEYSTQQTITSPGFSMVRQPVYTWQVNVAGAMFLNVEEHKVPNWFNRKMQLLILGFKWTRNK